jgi:hypothetical protein
MFGCRKEGELAQKIAIFCEQTQTKFKEQFCAKLGRDDPALAITTPSGGQRSLFRGQPMARRWAARAGRAITDAKLRALRSPPAGACGQELTVL